MTKYIHFYFLIIFLTLCSFAHSVEMTDGTLIFTRQNGRQGWLAKGVEKHTGSKLLHVAIYLDGWVYESVITGARRISFSEYMKHLNHKITQHPRKKRVAEFVPPHTTYSYKQIEQMKEYAESQRGRSYNFMGYIQNKEKRGIHCAQYIGNILEKSGQYKSSNWKESPVKIYNWNFKNDT